MRVSLFMRALLITLVGVSAVQGQSASFSLTNGSGEQGGTVTNSVLLDCNFDARGWSFGICAPEDDLLIESLEIGPDLQAVNGGIGPDFFSPTLYPGGVTAGVIVSFIDADYLPAGIGRNVHSVTYEVLASVGSAVSVCFCETLGTPPVTTIVVDPLGASVFPSVECGEIAVTPSIAPTVTLVTPDAHGMDGGSVVSIIGTGFTTEIANLVIGGVTTPIAQLTGDTLMEAFVPSLAPGLYGIALIDDQGGLILSVPDAIDVQVPRLPPLSDVSWKRDGSCLELEWRSWTALESISIWREGQLVAELAGSEQSFLDCSFPGEASYELVGLDDAGRLTASTRVFADTEPCEPVLSMPMIGDLRLDLDGGSGPPVPSFFELTQPAPSGIRIVTLAERQTLDGLIQATIYPVGNPGSPVATGITFAQSPVTLGMWPLEAYAPTALPAGSYVIEYSVFGGTTGITHFQLASSTITADVGAPFPCPPYAYTHVEALCGNTPPYVTDVSQVVPDSASSLQDSPFSSSTISQFTVQPGLIRILRANSGDFDGHVVRFFWDFGDGTTRATTTDTVSHVYATAGIYEVQVTVEDNDGLRGFAAKTLSIKPYLPATSAVQVEVLNHDPNDTLVPDLSTLDVFRTYTALVVPSIGKSVDNVVMQIIDPITGLATATVNPATPTLDPTCFTATFNVSEFPNRESVTLRVFAVDTGGVIGINEVVIPLCTRPELGTNFVWSYDIPSRVYRVVGQLDAATLYQQTFSLGSISPSFANSLPFRVAYQLRLHQRQWYADSLEAILEVTILGSTKISKSISIKSQYATLLPCPNFGVHYEREDIRLFDWTWGLSIFSNQPLANATILLWGVPVLYVDVYGSLSVAAGFEVDLDIDATLQSIAPHFDLEACFKPKATISAIGSANLSVSALRRRWRVFTATGTLYPVITLELPIQLDLEIAPSDFDLLVRDYWNFDIDYRVNGKVLWKKFDTGRRDAAAWDFNFITGPAPTCYVPGGASGVPLEQPIESRSPALATSPDGTRSLLVYVDEIAVGSDLTQSMLRYATLDGGSWTSGELIFPFAQGADTEPTAVFTTNDKVWIAWTHNSWTEAEVAAITLDSESINDYYRDNEIYCAEYTFGGGWSTPIRVTDDQRFQNEAAITAVSGSEVCVTWVTREDPSLLNVDGDWVDSPLTIATSFVNATGPSPCLDISSVAGTPAGVNRAPTIDFEGAAGQVVWIEEGAAYSRIVTSAFDGVSWSAPTVLLESNDAALDAPSLVLDAAGSSGVVAYTHEEGLSGFSGFGFNQRLGILELGGGTVIDHVLPGDRCLQSFEGSSPYVMNPRITRLATEGLYAVAGRVVVSSDPNDVDPEVGIWRLDLSTGDAVLSSAQLLTDDELDQLEPVVNVQADGQVIAAWNELEGDPIYQGLVTTTSDLRADLAIGQVLVGNPWAQPGESVSVQIEVANRGLALSESMSTSIQIGTVDSGSFVEVGSLDLPSVPGPGESVNALLEFVATTPAMSIEVRLVPGAFDLDDSNDVARLRLGIQPPENVLCEEIEGSVPRRTLLTWQNPQIYDSVVVLRDGISLVELTGSAESYVDLDAPSGAHAYSVRGMLRGRGTAAAATCSSSTPFIRGDANGDGSVNLSDPISMLGALFGGVVLTDCQDALDANDDGQVNIGDTVSLLSFLFTGGSPPPAPFPDCGTDPTADDLDCLEFSACP